MAEPRATLPRTRRAGSLPAFDRLAPPPAEADVRHWIGGAQRGLGHRAWSSTAGVAGSPGRPPRTCAAGCDLESTALTRLVAEIVLRPPDLRHLDAAFTALAGQQRNGVTLRESIERGFASRCANCGGPVIVEEYIWDGDAIAPSRRSYRCGHCRESRTGDSRTVPGRPGGHRRRQAAPTAIRPAAGSSAASRSPTPITSCPTSCWTCTRPGRWTPSRAPSSASRVTCVRPGSRPRCGWCWWACCCRRASSTASRAGSPSHAIVAGRLRPVGDRQWRERNPWLLLEDSFRLVRGFVQRLETGRQGHFHARFGPDLMALRDGSANVVVRQGLTLSPDEGEPPGTGAYERTGAGAFERTGTEPRPVTGARAQPAPAAPDGPLGGGRCGWSSPSRPSTGRPRTSPSHTSRPRSRWAWKPTLSLPLDLVFEAPPRTEQPQ